MYRIYQIEGFVIGSAQVRDANRRIALLTREFGLIRVDAQSVRLVKSKLRFHSQLYTHGVFDVLKGKSGWRLVGAYPTDSCIPLELYSVFARLFRFLLGHIQDEESVPDVYESLLKLVSLPLDEQSRDVCEVVGLASFLGSFGYLGDDMHRLSRHILDQQSFELVGDSFAQMQYEVNQALRVAVA